MISAENREEGARMLESNAEVMWRSVEKCQLELDVMAPASVDEALRS